MEIADFNDLEIIPPGESPRKFVCAIHAPEQREGAWVTAISDPETGIFRDIVGDDSAQSLGLAVDFIATRIRDLHEKGFRWRHQGAGTECRFEGHPIIVSKLREQ